MSARHVSAPVWAKGLPLDAAVHRFTVGDDPLIDLALLPFDALGTAAHALTLARGGWLNESETQRVVAALDETRADARKGYFSIAPEQEDGHTALEAMLVARLGQVGKRVHLGRSRNDQVILAMRLLLRRRLLELGLATARLAGIFSDFSEQHRDLVMPGYTHLRRAMPSSLGQWSAAFGEGLMEELGSLEAILYRLDACPAGTAAGFGSPVPLQRDYMATLLGFSRVARNPVAVVNARGRHELAAVQWVAGIGGVLEKFLWDVALYSTEEFGFLALPDAFTTGSSIMPQKRNPDVVELARATCRELRGQAGLVEQLASGLPSSYHRDAQLLKGPTLSALERGEALVDVISRLVPALLPVPERLSAACSPELWAAHEASLRAMDGATFRDAYRAVADELRNGCFVARPCTGAGKVSEADLAALRSDLAGVVARLDDRLRVIEVCETRIWSHGQ